MKKQALITGGSRGIGFAIADFLASQCYDLILLAKNPEHMDAAHSQLHTKHPECKVHTYIADLSNISVSEAAITNILTTHPSIDIFINNAGILEMGMTSVSAEKLGKLFTINCISSLVIANAVAEQMKRNRKGYIINMASIAGVTPVPKIGVYSSSKAAIVGYSQALFKECLHYNVRVTCLCPSVVDTDMTNDGLMHNATKIAPSDIIKSVDYLLSLGEQTIVERLDIHCKIIAKMMYPAALSEPVE